MSLSRTGQGNAMKMTVDYLTELSGDPAELRQVFSMFPSGVVTVAALNDKGKPVGMVASSFTSVSLDPPLVSICIQNTSATWPVLHASKRLGVSVMTQEQKRYAGRSPERTATGSRALIGRLRTARRSSYRAPLPGSNARFTTNSRPGIIRSSCWMPARPTQVSMLRRCCSSAAASGLWLPSQPEGIQPSDGRFDVLATTPLKWLHTTAVTAGTDQRVLFGA